MSVETEILEPDQDEDMTPSEAAPLTDATLFKRATKFWREIKNKSPEAKRQYKLHLVSRGFGPELVEVLFGAKELFDLQQTLDQTEKSTESGREQRREILVNLTEIQYLLTKFILGRTHNRQGLIEFWDLFDRAAGPNTQEARSRRRGLLSQVAAHKILQALGLKPELATPAQDAFDAVDLWDGHEGAYQIAGAAGVARPDLLEVEEVAPVSSRVSEVTANRAGKKYYSADFNLERKRRNFSFKLNELRQRSNEPITGHMMVIPEELIDPVTGEPSSEPISFFRAKLGKIN